MPHAVPSKQKVQKELGKRIKAIREAKGISQKDFESFDNSIHRGDLSVIESGQSMPNVYTLFKIAAILEVDVADFFKKG